MADRDDPGPDRRKFLKVATTCAVGGGVGLAVGVPALGLLAGPASATTVTTPTEPLDLGPLDRFKIGGDPRRVEVVAPVVQDGWTSARDVVLGAAWIRRLDDQKLEAFSSVCPHLGCAIGYVRGAAPGAGHYLCACHDSKFDVAGARTAGPVERGLDPLPVEIRGGRLRLTWMRYRLGGASREPA